MTSLAALIVLGAWRPSEAWAQARTSRTLATLPAVGAGMTTSASAPMPLGSGAVSVSFGFSGASLGGLPPASAAPAPAVAAGVLAVPSPGRAAGSAPEARVFVAPEGHRVIRAEGASPEALRSVERALAGAERLRSLLDSSEGRPTAESMADAAQEFDALVRGADEARGSGRLWIQEAHFASPPFAVPWSRYHAGLVRRQSGDIRALRPGPGGGWRGALARFSSRRAEAAFWRRLSESGRPIPSAPSERDAWLAQTVRTAAAPRIPPLSAPRIELDPVSYEIRSLPEGVDERVIRDIVGAARGVRKVAQRLPFSGPDAARGAMQALATDLVTLLHHAEAALGMDGVEVVVGRTTTSLTAFHGRVLQWLAGVYEHRGRAAGSGALARYTAKQILAESFWSRVGHAFWVPPEESRRRAWLKTVVDRFQ